MSARRYVGLPDGWVIEDEIGGLTVSHGAYIVAVILSDGMVSIGRRPAMLECHELTALAKLATEHRASQAAEPMRRAS